MDGPQEVHEFLELKKKKCYVCVDVHCDVRVNTGFGDKSGYESWLRHLLAL